CCRFTAAPRCASSVATARRQSVAIAGPRLCAYGQKESEATLSQSCKRNNYDAQKIAATNGSRHCFAKPKQRPSPSSARPFSASRKNDGTGRAPKE
ncbi:hypothetical protein MLD52_22055, partial [Puniceicoccaceae bacterium K14]|nr:hypothetical protein [Puniceicoccaceae bacterium K14]